MPHLPRQPNTHWHTAYSGTPAAYPHRVVIDLGSTQTLRGIRHLGRAGDAKTGRIKNYRVYLSDQPFGLTPAS